MTKNKISVTTFILMMLTSVFGALNIGIGFFQMGYAAIPLFLIGGILFFVPFLMMMVEFSSAFNEDGGIFTWMKNSVSLKFAFFGIMMWYSSYIVWMFGKSYSIWVPLSFFLFGKDVTINLSPFILGIIASLLVISVTWIVTNGVSILSKIAAIGGIAVIGLNFILLIGGLLAFIINGFTLQVPMTAGAFTTSPNPDFQSLFPFLGFLTFGIFAYGGTEAIAGVSQDLENPKKDTKKAIFISGAFIIICYSLGFLAVGAILPFNEFYNQGYDVSSLSALFIIMRNLGDTVMGVDNSLLGEILVRFSGLGIFLSFIGAMITLFYSPLNQVIKGTPKEFWPESFQKTNSSGIRTNALKFQAVFVVVFVMLKGIFSLLDPSKTSALFDLIVQMQSVAMTIPYLFLIFAWYKFRHNDKLEKGIILVKSEIIILVMFLSSFIMVTFGNVFSIVSPFKDGDFNRGIWIIFGPVLFIIIAYVIYTRGQQAILNKKSK